MIKNKVNYKHIIIACIIIFLIFYIIIYDDLNIQEGWIGVFNDLFIFLLFGVPFFVLIYIGFFRILLHSYKNDNKREFLKHFFVVGWLWFIFSIPLFFSISKIYYLLFETKNVILIEDYTLQYEKSFYLGNGRVYYLNFDNKSFRVNPETYHRLNVDNKYTLKISYKKKAGLIFNLQILPK